MSETPIDGRPPTMVGFSWNSSPSRLALTDLSGDLWCVRDAFSELMEWPPSSKEWDSFIEGPSKEDMDRLCTHLGLAWCDPVRQPKEFDAFKDHPGIAVYALRTEQMSHVVFQPHLRHLRELPPSYCSLRPVLFSIIADLRQPPRKCPECQNQSRNR